MTVDTGNLKTAAARALGKVRMSLVPVEAVYEIAKVFTYGATKYAAWDWLEHPGEYSFYLDAMARHIDAWVRLREDHAEDSGLHHLAHAGTNVMILLTLALRGVGTDDRQPCIFDSHVDTPRRHG